MVLYIYKKEIKSIKKIIISHLSTFILFLGAALLFWAFYPVLSFEIYSRLFINQGYSSPIPLLKVKKQNNSKTPILGVDTLKDGRTDLTQASLWFPSADQNRKKYQKIFVKEYFLTIPKLNINDARVVVGGEDLTKSLIHYLPSSLPGEKGNVVIFGHSTLPQLYDTKDYKTIFTYLSSLGNDDLVKIRVGEETYNYKVSEMYVVKPDKTSVLEQIFDASYLTLITCVPPGTYWNRLVVKAKLLNNL